MLKPMTSYITPIVAAALLLLPLVLPLPAQAQSKDEIEEAQKILMLTGHFARRPTGEMTPQTVEGLQKFQTQAKLPVTGKLDAATLNALRNTRDTKFSNPLSLESAQKRQQQAAAAAAAPPPKVAAVPQASVSGQALGGSQQVITGYGQRGGGSVSPPSISAPSVTGGTPSRVAPPLPAAPQASAQILPPGISNRPPVSQRSPANPMAAPQEDVTVTRTITTPPPVVRTAEEPGILSFWPWLTVPGILAIFGWVGWQATFARPRGPNPFLAGAPAGQGRQEPGL
jgi:peptidoglycan hydrolase-like protein with peptidoglycan-binding domain